MNKILNTVFMACMIAVLAISCSEDDGINIVLQPDPTGIEFTNSLSSNYLLSSAAASNIAERLVWNPVDFGAPIEATFRLEGSIDQSMYTEISTSGENNIAVKVSDLLTLAEELGLDEDAATTDNVGNPNNTGVVYVRVVGISGSNSTANTEQVISDVLPMNIELIESGEALDPVVLSSFGLVGEAINNWGGDGPDIPMYTRDEKVHFVAINNPGAGTPFSIRQNNDWVVNYGGDLDAGTLETASFDNGLVFPEGNVFILVVDTENLTISLEEGDSWGLAGENINAWGTGPDIRLSPDPKQEGIWIALNVDIPAGAANFRLNNDWSSVLSPVEEGSNILGLNLGFGPTLNLDAGTFNITLDTRNPDEITVDFESL
ncbi:MULTISPECIES: SusE domain-containing protein [Flavobacteriaceae]|uniref:SusE domain-containing protein n=1 Tax=Flavobacteriaceae TaxID=49546 RepID=UPI001491715D|nr:MULTISPECIES: SusE domain-containing protein [Allomuricauda]MDC6367314.1 SusE domain-containing protein [Muricauda sp. AC10]